MKLRRTHIALAITLPVMMIIMVFGVFLVLRNESKKELIERQTHDLLVASRAIGTSDFESRLDLVRVFINENTTHVSNLPSRPLTQTLQDMIYYIRSETDDRPLLDNAARRGVMKAMLKSLGYQTRTARLYNPETMNSHAMIEVLDPKTGSWHAQDPDYDVYWINTKSGKRVSIGDVLQSPDTHEPCGRNLCGWDHHNLQGMNTLALKPYLQVLVLKEADEEMTYYRPEINPDAVHKVGGRTGQFCDIITNACDAGYAPIVAYKNSAEDIKSR